MQHVTDYEHKQRMKKGAVNRRIRKLCREWKKEKPRESGRH